MNSRNVCLLWKDRLTASLHLPKDPLAPPMYSMFCVSAASPGLYRQGGVRGISDKTLTFTYKTFFSESHLLARMIQSLTKLHRETGKWQGYSSRWCLMASLKAHKGWTHRLNRSGPQRGMIDGQDVCSTFTWKKCINTILSVLSVFRLEVSWSQGKPQQGLSVQIS